MTMRLAICASHPIQYHAPLFRQLAQGMDIEVFFAHRPTATDQASAGFGVKFEWDVDILSGYSYTFLNNISKRPGLDHFFACDTPAIRLYLRDGNFDSILVMGWHMKSYVQGVLAAKRLGIPVMVRGDSQLGTRRSLLKRTGKMVVYPLLLRTFDSALYVGQRSREYYRYYGYPEERLFFSPHCVDNDWFTVRADASGQGALRDELGIGELVRLVLFAGKLLPFKRPLDVVEACGRLQAAGQEVELLIAGSGELEMALTARARALELPLHLLGFCNQTRMPSAYAAADVLVLPSSSSETWGLVVNEALACGTPVVVSEACGCAPDLVADGLVGRVYPEGDIIALATAIEHVLENKPSGERFKKKLETYSPASATSGIVEAMEFLVE